MNNWEYLTKTFDINAKTLDQALELLETDIIKEIGYIPYKAKLVSISSFSSDYKSFEFEVIQL